MIYVNAVVCVDQNKIALKYFSYIKTYGLVKECVETYFINYFNSTFQISTDFIISLLQFVRNKQYSSNMHLFVYFIRLFSTFIPLQYLTSINKLRETVDIIKFLSDNLFISFNFSTCRSLIFFICSTFNRSVANISSRIS